MKGSQTAIIDSKGAFLCFDVDCDARLEFHGEMVGEDGDLLEYFLRNDRFVVALDVVLRDGGGLKFIMDRALEYHQNHPYPFWINKFWPPTSTGKSKETRPQPEQLVRIRGIRYDESADDPATAQRLLQRIRSLHKRAPRVIHTAELTGDF